MSTINCSYSLDLYNVGIIRGMIRFKEYYDQYLLLREGARDKINRIQKMSGGDIDNILKVLITKYEDTINWNEVFEDRDGDPIRNINSQLSEILDDIPDRIPSQLKDKVSKFVKYMKDNNYNLSFIYLFTKDFVKKFRNTRSAIPEIQTHVLGDLSAEVKGMSNFGNLIDIYRKLDKEIVGGSNGSVTEQWVVIPSKQNDPEGYEDNLAKLMSYSACKTGWCVRGSGMASLYLDYSDFHLYLDDEGDAVVSLRVVDDNVEEVSGTEGGDSQTVSDDYRDVVVEYVNVTGYSVGGGGDGYYTKEKKIDDIYEENEYYTKYDIHRHMEDFHNWRYYIEIYSGDEDLEFFDIESDSDELWDIIDKGKVLKSLSEEDGVDESEIGDGELIEHLEEEYDFNFPNIYSNVYESTAYSAIVAALSEKVEEISKIAVIASESLTLDDNIELISRDNYTELLGDIIPDDDITIEKFFDDGQPPIQRNVNDGDLDYILSEYPELHIETYINEIMDDIVEPSHGWGEWDFDTLKRLINENHPDVVEKFGL